MFLTIGIVLAFGATSAEAATTPNSYTNATSSSSVDPTVRANVNRSSGLSSCPTILVGSDSLPVAVCTRFLSNAPVLMLFDRTGTKVLVTKALKKPAVAGAMPAYLDSFNRLVIVNGDRIMSRFSHGQWSNGDWTFGLSAVANLAKAIPSGDRVVGLQPDNAGRVWFATANGNVGTADTSFNVVRTIRLRAGERVQKDLSLVSSRIVATTDRAVYKLTASSNGIPKIVARAAR